ncbi:unnamed protein product [Kluyveromyces dobzhanskii CBS 2104]|uniref:WGS project CCBQ000000000 data, contig 00099 n=1 Tax=Kluyveromyces dobzhanskii CBS 2104 TaxID=1427455 RepID=A0A0A8L1V1_9SACH|nr:unnamed protein product [Kluyveromyces dobzhanskii CBS 2104]
MLHGLAQSGPYFEFKTKGFRRVLEPLGYEFFYATAPNKLSPADLPTDAEDLGASSGDDYHTWIQPDPVKGDYRLPEVTVKYLKEYVLENGPFDGVCGFSQGGGITGYLMTDFNNLLGLSEEEQPPLKFFIVFSGFRFTPAIYQEQYNAHPINVNSLHVRGQLDTVTDSGDIQRLYDSCTEDTRTLLEHPGGHFVPNSKGFVTKIADWLNSLE